ncbi:MAG: hypothetical protein WBA77_03900 [Microcoleaceae cyanobacterium]
MHDHEILYPEIYQPAAEAFEVYQVTHKFYQEAQYRQACQNHDQWYREVAQAHQQELEKMRGDINLFGWFSKWRN